MKISKPRSDGDSLLLVMCRRLFLFVASLLFVSIPTVYAQVPEELPQLDKWMTHYYLQPKPDEVSLALKTVDTNGYFNNQEAQAPLSGFFTELFRANPERIQGWIEPYKGRSGLHILYSALWLTNLPQGKAALETLASAAIPVEAEFLKELLQRTPPTIQSMTVDSPAVLDHFWGRFMGSGAEAPVLRVIDQVKLVETRGNVAAILIGGAAQWSVASNARQHDRVLQIVKSRAPASDPVTKKMLVEILNEIEAEQSKRKQ